MVLNIYQQIDLWARLSIIFISSSLLFLLLIIAKFYPLGLKGTEILVTINNYYNYIVTIFVISLLFVFISLLKVKNLKKQV